MLVRVGVRYQHAHARPAVSASLQTATSGVPTAADQAVWRLGQLALRPCEIGGGNGLASVGAYCTRFAVPENWQAPSGRHIELKVAVVKAEGAPDADFVTFLDGGPGGAATDDYPAIAPALAPLRARHNILLIDQRGTGGSNALQCTQLSSDQQSPQQLVQANEPGELSAVLQRCLAQLAPRAAPQYYTTTAAVRDLEAVRQALGSPALDLIGVSYGTRVAQQYARALSGLGAQRRARQPRAQCVGAGRDHARNLERVLRGCVGALPCRCGLRPALRRSVCDAVPAARAAAGAPAGGAAARSGDLPSRCI